MSRARARIMDALVRDAIEYRDRNELSARYLEVRTGRQAAAAGGSPADRAGVHENSMRRALTRRLTRRLPSPGAQASGGAPHSSPAEKRNIYSCATTLSQQQQEEQEEQEVQEEGQPQRGQRNYPAGNLQHHISRSSSAAGELPPPTPSGSATRSFSPGSNKWAQ